MYFWKENKGSEQCKVETQKSGLFDSKVIVGLGGIGSEIGIVGFSSLGVPVTNPIAEPKN